MKCDACDLELQDTWNYCPDCGDTAPVSEATKAQWKAEREERMPTDPAYKAQMDRMAEHHKMMEPLLEAQWKHYADQFVKDAPPTTINIIKGSP